MNVKLSHFTHFSKYLEEEEASIENLEQKLDRTLKLCTLMIDSGKEYVKNQSVFATSLWELHSHFKENKVAQNALNKIITCFQVIFIHYAIESILILQ